MDENGKIWREVDGAASDEFFSRGVKDLKDGRVWRGKISGRKALGVEPLRFSRDANETICAEGEKSKRVGSVGEKNGVWGVRGGSGWDDIYLATASMMA